jgi:hypothetical protein
VGCWAGLGRGRKGLALLKKKEKDSRRKEKGRGLWSFPKIIAYNF